MCNYAAPKQFAYVDPQDKFQRLKTPITNQRRMKAVIDAVPHKAVYESVYGWKDWIGGRITPEISKTAVVNCIFLDFDDAEDPGKALMDAAEVAQYVGHCTGNFSGAKGAHILIHCHAVDLIPELKGHVIRRFVNNLVDVLPELDTLDYAVVGDTSRVHRIINSVHSKTKLHAIGLTAEELSTLTIDEVHLMAQNRRGLIQVPEPSKWVTDELYRIEGEIISRRFKQLYETKGISLQALKALIGDIDILSKRFKLYEFLDDTESEWRRIRARRQVDQRGSVIRGERIGATKEETWLLRAVAEFKATGRAASGSRKAEHKERVHLAKLANECGWTFSEICDIYTGADDYDPAITERMVRSCIGRR